MSNLPRKIKICFVVDFFTTLGGVQSVVHQLATSLDRDRIKVDIVALKGDCDFSLPDDMGIFLLRSKKIRYSVGSLKDYFDKECPDIVIASYEEVVCLTLIASTLAGSRCPVIWWQHAHFSSQLRLTSSNAAEFIMKYVLYFLMARFASGFVAVSRGVKDDLVRAMKLPIKKVVHLRNPTPRVTTSNVLNKFAEQRLRFIFIGRLSKQKQVDHIIEAIRMISQDLEILIDIIGDGEELNRLTQAASTLPKRHQVIFHGANKNPWGIVKENSVLLLCSLFEGYGMVLVEAKNRGIPVISYDCPSGPNEIVADGVDGILVPPQDVRAFAGAIERFLREPDLFRRLQKGALSRSGEYQEDCKQFERFIFKCLEWT